MHATHSIKLTGTAQQIDLQLFTKAKFYLTLEPAKVEKPQPQNTQYIIDFGSNPAGGFLLPAHWQSCTVTVLYNDKNAILVCEERPTPADQLRTKVKQALARQIPRDKAPPFLGLLLPNNQLLIPAIPEHQAA